MEMTNRDIALLSFKILAIFAFIRAVELSSKVIQYFYEEATEGYIWIGLQVLLPPVLLILIGIILWIFAPNLSRYVFASSDSNKKSEAVSYTELQTIIFSAFGLIVIVDSLPLLIRSIIAIFMFKVYSISGKESVLQRNIYLLFTALKTVIGIWLLFGSRGVVKFVQSLRRG